MSLLSVVIPFGQSFTRTIGRLVKFQFFTSAYRGSITDGIINMKKISNTYTALICLFLVIRWVSANVEKVIFLGPSPTLLPDDYPNLAQLGLHELFSSRSSVRNYLPASFPREEKPEGDETWVLLDGLEKGRRYEVRICWAATVRTYELSFLT